MGFWIFKKKEDKKAHERIDNVHKILKNSFKNVKKDIEDLGEWQKESHEKHKNKFEDFEKRLQNIERHLASINKKEIYENNLEKKEENNEKGVERALNSILETLTSKQLEIYVKIYHLQKQIGTKISYKSIANLMYANKDYNEVRSTISEYISFLEINGLIKKFRKGRESYVGITDTGLKLLKRMKAEKKIEIMND